MKDNGNKDLTKGSLLKYLITLGFPVILGLIMHNLYSLVDIYWVGKIGADSIAAVTLCTLLFFIVFAIAQIFGMGTLAIVSRYYGQSSPDKAKNTIRNAVFISLITGTILSAGVFVFAKEMVVIIGANNGIVPVALEYIKPFCVGFVFQLLSFTINFGIRGTGDMNTPMVLMFTATISNIILDPLLIFGWGPFPAWGVMGAGLATAISQFLSAALAIFVIVKGYTELHVPLTWKFRPDWEEIWKIIRIGTPVGMQFFILSLSIFILIRIIAQYGEATVAALGIAWRIMHTTSIPVIGIGAAVATLVGQNLGAGLPDRATKATNTGILLAASTSGFISLAFFLFPDFFIGVFTKDPDVVRVGVLALRITVVSQVFIAVAIIYQHCFSGSGYTFPTMLSALIRAFVVLALAFILPEYTGYGVGAIFMCIPISTFIGMTVLFLFYRTGRWKTRMDKLESNDALKPIIPVSNQ